MKFTHVGEMKKCYLVWWAGAWENVLLLTRESDVLRAENQYLKNIISNMVWLTLFYFYKSISLLLLLLCEWSLIALISK